MNRIHKVRPVLRAIRARIAMTMALAATVAPGFVYAQQSSSGADLQRYFNTSSQVIRGIYTNSWQLLLQRQPALAQVTVDASRGACLGRAANRSALGCDAADTQCAAAVNTRMLRQVVMAQVDIVHGLRMIRALPEEPLKGQLLDQAAFQSAVLRRVLANIVSDRGASQLVNFGTLTTRAAPAPGAPLPARIESVCDVNDAQLVPLKSLSSGEALLGNTSIILFSFVSPLGQNPNSSAICAAGTTPVAGLSGNPCEILSLHVAEILRRIGTG